MTARNGERITIVGTGLAGSLLACFLARRGFEVVMYERRGDPRVKGFAGGRSINLALSARGIDALERAGLAERVMQAAIPMKGRMLHDAEGKLGFQPYSADPKDAINSVSRGGLNLILLEAAAEYPNARQVFDHRCVGIDLDKSELHFERSDGTKVTERDAGVIIGADGAFSAVRLAMMLRMDRMDYRQDYLEHGYKELHIPPLNELKHEHQTHRDSSNPFAMERNALHIWPRGGSMMIALPNVDGSFTCTLFWPIQGEGGLESLRTEAEIKDYFEKQYPDAVPLMPTLVEDYQMNPIGSLVTVHCSPWHYKDRAVILGDAAHAIVPFYGQGMNCAFEDVVAMDACIEEYGNGWERVFAELERRRKVHSDAIAEMAVENFVEMRDHVASKAFLLKKRAGQMLHKMFPEGFMPLYNMISFSTIPYAEARARARKQKNILAGIGWGVVGVVCVIVLAVVWWTVKIRIGL